MNVLQREFWPSPKSPDEADWSYETGTELRDPTSKEAADYYVRVAGWYTAGGFVDELGMQHHSQHHENITWWEILNEPEYEHGLDIQTYTRLYDHIVAAVRQVTTNTRFVGMSLAEVLNAPEKFALLWHARQTAYNKGYQSLLGLTIVDDRDEFAFRRCVPRSIHRGHSVSHPYRTHR